MSSPPPLTGLRVLELAGLAPGPYCGLLLADYGATVLRLDRPHPSAYTASAESTADLLTRRKHSLALSLKDPSSIRLFKSLIPHVDIIIDPFRPGVLERLGLSPHDTLLKLNPRLIIARLTGYRRDGRYASMAGHDINYLAVAGVLSMLGPPGQPGKPPIPPANILGDFAGGGASAFMGILLALLHRERTGRGQVVESNMVDGAAYLATFPRLLTKRPGVAGWSAPRGTNLLDGGAPFYACYETSDGQFMSVGALEPQFFQNLLDGLELGPNDWGGADRMDKRVWPKMKEVFTKRFKERTRQHWEDAFDGTDACVAPVKSQQELERVGFDQRPMVTLRESPAHANSQRGHPEKRPVEEGYGPGVIGEGWHEQGLPPGRGAQAVLKAWMGWERDRDYKVQDGGVILQENKLKL